MLRIIIVTGVTDKLKWDSAVKALEPVPRGIDVMCRESGPNDTIHPNLIRMLYSTDLELETVDLLLDRLRKIWPEITSDKINLGLI